ncbi:hydroxyurea phosphotransferase [Streptomyces aurantiogriseus]|uniref:Hydroxyurea phosphotransferase n=2 Tax=Streptomyces aurantiogriseus TaxID=66870 RepID=A0A918FK75_9ACTN|nr:hydroxyurea phosphotransferase [Streptomyces aurantiogriseus]
MSRFMPAGIVPGVIDIPGGLAAAQVRANGEAGRAFIAALPGLAAEFLQRWELRIDGPSMHGVTALVLPVTAADGTRAVLKLQLLDEESAGEPVALQTWDGDRAVRLLRHDEATGTMLLERLDPARMLSHVPDTHEAVLVIARLLARLTAVPAPPGLRRLDDIAQAMLDDTPRALERIADPADRRLIDDCAAAVREVAGESGDRLLHWDLHDENVLAADRAPWLAIDPKPLAGDPGFELWPALNNRFDLDDVDWRFDAMTEVLGLDRERARAWTLGRVLQNALWEIEDGDPPPADDLAIARRLRNR